MLLVSTTTKILRLFLLFQLIIVIGCKKEIKPEKPEAKAPQKKYKPIPSTFNIPIEMEIAEIERQVNNSMSGVLYEDHDEEDVKVKVSKASPISVRIYDQEIFYDIPLHIEARVRKSALGMTFSKSTDFSTTLKFNTTVGVEKDWSLTTETRSLGYDITKKPELSLGPFTIPITLIVEKAMDKYLDVAAKQLDEQVREEFDLRDHIFEAYKYIQRPMMVNEDYNLWLMIRPQEVYMSPITSTTSTLHVNVGVKGFVELFSGKKPDIFIDYELPPLEIKEFSDDEFKLALATDISYKQATAMLREYMIGYEYEHSKKKKVTVTDVEVYGNGDRLELSVSFEGAADGKVFMSGVPVYDPSSQSISVQELEYDLDSKKALIKVADWMLHGTFRKRIERMMHIPLKDDLMEARVMMNNSLKDNRIDESLLLDCSISTMEPYDIFPRENTLRTILMVEGKGKLHFRGQ